MTLREKLKSYAMDNHFKKYGELNAKNLENIADMFAIDFTDWISENGYVKMNDKRWYLFKEVSFTTLELLYKFKQEKGL